MAMASTMNKRLAATGIRNDLCAAGSLRHFDSDIPLLRGKQKVCSPSPPRHFAIPFKHFAGLPSPTFFYTILSPL
jgi:hypothetical protein